MHKGAIIGIIVAVVAIGGFLASPLFYETEVNEPLPVLTAQEEQVIRLRFGIGAGRKHTHQEVAQRFSLSGEQIRQIELTAFRKLRQPPYTLHRRLQ